MNTHKIKPNFIIIGAMKSATTSLYAYLKQHPDIFMTDIKEPMFFNNLNKKNTFIIKEGRKKRTKINTFEEYYTLFRNANNQKAIGEASPEYIYTKECPELIKKHLPNTKIIAILRQPIERAYSNFLHAKRSGKENIKDFITAIDEEEYRIKKDWSPLYHYINKGYYFKQLERYYKLFEKENIKIILFDELKKNPVKTTQNVFRFLNVDDSFTPNTKKKANVSGVPKGLMGYFITKIRYYNLMPNIELSKYLNQHIINFIYNMTYNKPDKINPSIKKELTSLYYKKDIEKLESLTNYKLENWLK